MTDVAISYEFDLDGTNPNNLIVREPHPITDIDPRTQSMLVPYFPPFHPNDFLIETRDADDVFNPLVQGVDFDLAMPWYSFEKETGHFVYGAAAVHRKPVAPMVYITYRTLGKPWIADRRKVLEALANYVWGPRIVQWDQITNIQETFPPNQHQQDLENFRKWSEVADQLRIMTEKMGEPVEPTLLYQQQVLYIRESYDGLLRRVENMEFEMATLKQRVAALENGR